MLCCVEMYSANFFVVQIYKLCKYFLFWRQIPIEADNLLYGNIVVVQIYLLCLYCCCANICFYWRQIPIEADALLCAPRNLFVQTPLTRHRHTPFHIRQPFQNIQHAVERSVCSRFLLNPSPIVVCLVTHYSLLNQC